MSGSRTFKAPSLSAESAAGIDYVNQRGRLRAPGSENVCSRRAVINLTTRFAGRRGLVAGSAASLAGGGRLVEGIATCCFVSGGAGWTKSGDAGTGVTGFR